MELHNVEPIICVTKEDLLKVDERCEIDNILFYYQSIGYSVVSNTELDKIKYLLKGKTTVFTGQTGAGKSTLLNRLQPDWNLETGEISLALGRGKHTTRVVELFSLFDGKVMDTPGFSALDFKDFSKKEIRESFIEFSYYSCPFKDCSHVNEKECEVRKAVFANNIMKSRYNDYLNFIGEEKNED